MIQLNALLSTSTRHIRERVERCSDHLRSTIGWALGHACNPVGVESTLPEGVLGCEDHHAREGLEKAQKSPPTSPTFKTQIPHPSSSVRTEPLTWPDGRGLAGSAEGPSAMFGGWGLESSGDRPSPSRPKPAPVSVPEEGQEDSFRFQDDAGHKPIPPCIRREYTTHPAQKRRPEDAKETHSGFGRRTPPLAAPLTCLRGVGRMCIHRLGE